MADETPACDTTSAPTPIESDEPQDDCITPGKVRKPRLAARPTFELHAVGVHLPALPSVAPAMLLEILPDFIRPAKLPTHACGEVSVHLPNRNRLAIFKTHHIELVSRLLSVESITLAGHTYSVAPYLAAPTNSCRGVIHGVSPDATRDELLRDLDCYQADILLARRMGNTTTALITFAGLHVPYSVYYHRLEFRCRPHKPRAHHCTICLQYGHRTCACPGNQRLCPTCSTAVNQPDEPHSCSPWCLHCQGHHAPFSATCPVRKQRDEACANAAMKQRLQHRQQWKNVNTPQAPAKASTPSAITEAPASSNLLPTHAHWGGQRSLLQAPPSSVPRPTPDVQPQPTAYQKPVPVKQDLPLQKPVQESCRDKPPWVGFHGCPRKTNLWSRVLFRPRRCRNPSGGSHWKTRHRTEPCAVYTQEERRLLCALYGVPEIHRSTHLASSLHAEHTAAERARRHPPTNAEAVTNAVLVLQNLRPDLLAAQPSPKGRGHFRRGHHQ
ncbi:hypothetical protein MTO96_018041 [Rhipicephalus appendiculatus]